MKRSTLERLITGVYGPIGPDGRRMFFSQWKRHGRTDGPQRAKRRHPRGILQLWKGKRGSKRVGKKHYVAVAAPKRVAKTPKVEKIAPVPSFLRSCTRCFGERKVSCSLCCGDGCRFCSFTGQRTCPSCSGTGTL